MVENSQIAGYNFVLQDCSGWNVDPVAMVSDDDDGPLEDDSLAEGHVAGHSQVVQLQQIRNGRKPL